MTMDLDLRTELRLNLRRKSVLVRLGLDDNGFHITGDRGVYGKHKLYLPDELEESLLRMIQS